MYQFESLTIALLESINDKTQNVVDSIHESLVTLGRKKAQEIIKLTYTFMSSNSAKLGPLHKTLILKAIKKIIDENLEIISAELLADWVKFTSKEMILQTNDKESELQKSTSSILVSIGKKHIKEVFTELQKNIMPGQLPHLYTINTLAQLAEVNAYGMVPYLTDVIATMLPMLGMAKLDTYKYSFAMAFSKFSEAIVFYCLNKPEASAEKQKYSAQIYSAYEIFFNVWIKTNDNNLRQITIESIGNLVSLIPQDKLESEIVKIIQGLLALFKKHSDHFAISQSIYLTLNASISVPDVTKYYETLIDLLMKELFAQAIFCNEQMCKGKGEANFIKSHNEILRCFNKITIIYSERMLAFLLQKIEPNNESSRVASLIILKHIINSNEEQLGNKKQIIISGLRVLLADKNNKIKRQLLQVIIAMAYHDYLKLEGSSLFIEYVVKQCALQSIKLSDANLQDTDEQIIAFGENILTLLSTTVENMHPLLWPHLFEFINKIEYLNASNLICKNLATIAEAKHAVNPDDLMIDFNDPVNSNIPKPYEIMAILVIKAGIPMNNNKRGLNVLRLMRFIAVAINPAISKLWETLVPKFINFLEEKFADLASFSAKQWEEMILKLLTKTIELLDNEEVICEIASAFGHLIESLFAAHSAEKNFAIKCLGMILSKTTNKKTIDRLMDVIFTSVVHTNQLEREGFAIGYGYIASQHLDAVLSKLEGFAKGGGGGGGGEAKKSLGLFSTFLGGGKSSENEQLKSSIVLAYGYITQYAPIDLILSRLEANILRTLSEYVSPNIKDLSFKQNLLTSISMITKCLHKDHIGKDFSFAHRITLMNQVLQMITVESPKAVNNEIRSICYKVLQNIVKLYPQPTEAEMLTIFTTITQSFFHLNPFEAQVNEKTDKAAAQAAALLPTGNEVETEFFKKTSEAFDALLVEILRIEIRNNGLASIFKSIQTWITSLNHNERQRSIMALSNVLVNYKEMVASNSDLPRPTLEVFVEILALMIPRSSDPVLAVRGKSIECIECLLFLQEKSELKSNFADLKEALLKDQSETNLTAIIDLSKLLCNRIPAGDQVLKFIDVIINGLLDNQSSSSIAACIFLNYFIKSRGVEFKGETNSFILKLYSKLTASTNEQTKLGISKTIRIIFKQNLTDSLNTLLAFPIPYKKELVDICKCLCEDPAIVNEILDNVIQLWNQYMPYEEKGNVKYFSLKPLVSTYLVNEIFLNNTNQNTQLVFKKYYEKLYGNVLIRVANSISNVFPDHKAANKSTIGKMKAEKQKQQEQQHQDTPAENEVDFSVIDPLKLSIDCLKNLIISIDNKPLLDYYNSQKLWTILGEELNVVNGYQIAAKGIILHSEPNLASIINHLNAYLASPYECQRICATAYYSELINCNSFELIESLLNSLLTKLIDTSIKVRQLCIRGLGNISNQNQQIQKFSTTILSAMIAGLDDKDDVHNEITLESLNGLVKIIKLINENDIRPIFINILLRIRNFFENFNPEIREKSFNLFGKLARFGVDGLREPYLEQIHSNFVSFILHLNEDDERVKVSSAQLLFEITDHLDSTLFNEFIQKNLKNLKAMHYEEWINELSKLMINIFPEKINFFIMNNVSQFKNVSIRVKCNAVLFAGYLIGNLPKEKQILLSKEHISNALIKLLKDDQSTQVKEKAAESISLLAEF